MLQKIKATAHKHQEILSYLFWGVMPTLVSWGMYSFFVTVMKSVATANILSWICAVLFAFITNKMWVFRSTGWLLSSVLPELWKFIAARLATGLLEIIGVPFLVSIGLRQRILGIEGMASKILVSIVVVILNYVLSKLLVFKNKNSPSRRSGRRQV